MYGPDVEVSYYFYDEMLYKHSEQIKDTIEKAKYFKLFVLIDQRIEATFH